MGTLVGTFEKYPPLTHWVKDGRIVSEPTMYSAWTHWVIDPLPPVYGELDEEIYMEQPEGFLVPGKASHVLRLRRALYGLKQASLAWWRALKQSMEELGFTSLASDAGVFYYRGEGSFVVAIIYVDDAIFCGPSKSLVLKLKEAFMKRWETWDLGEVTEFLRMRITRNGSSIHLDQSAYLRTVLQ